MKQTSMLGCDKTECIIVWVSLVASISLIGGGSGCIYKSEKTNYDCSIVLGVGISILIFIVLFYLFNLFTYWLDKKEIVVKSPITVV